MCEERAEEKRNGCERGREGMEAGCVCVCVCVCVEEGDGL